MGKTFQDVTAARRGSAAMMELKKSYADGNEVRRGEKRIQASSRGMSERFLFVLFFCYPASRFNTTEKEDRVKEYALNTCRGSDVRRGPRWWSVQSVSIPAGPFKCHSAVCQ